MPRTSIIGPCLPASSPQDNPAEPCRTLPNLPTTPGTRPHTSVIGLYSIVRLKQSFAAQLTHCIREPPYLPTFQIAAFISTYFNTSMRNQPMKPVTIMQTIISGIKK
jgi:hypothetical protein